MLLSAAPNESSSWISVVALLRPGNGVGARLRCLRRQRPLEHRASTPIAPTTPTPTNKWSVAGQVVATGSQQGVGGATLTPGWSLAPVTADAEGNYELGDRVNPPSRRLPVDDFAIRLHLARRVDHMAARPANERDAGPDSRCAAVFDGLLPRVHPRHVRQERRFTVAPAALDHAAEFLRAHPR